MYDTNYSPVPPVVPLGQPKNPVLGIISLIIAIVATVIICSDVVIAILVSGDSYIAQSYSTVDTLLTCGTGVLALVGFGLGVAAVIQKNKKKVFSILGLVLNGLILLGICAIYAINLITLISSGAI